MISRLLNLSNDFSQGFKLTPEGFLKSRPVNKSKVLTTSQALNLMKQRGYIIKDDVIPIP